MPTRKQHNKMIAVEFELKRRNPKSRKVKNPMKTAITTETTVKHIYEDGSTHDIIVETGGETIKIKQGNDWIYAHHEQAKKIAEIILNHFKTTYNEKD